jgi:tRNA(Ser,Leu) C12 N-acetylase TAN1
MEDWNVVVTIRDGGFRKALRFLRRLGPIDRTGLYNVLVMKPTDSQAFLEGLRQQWADDPSLASVVSRVMPVTHTFKFATHEEFEARAREAVRNFVPALTGRSFHVRLHRRGQKGVLSTPGEERFLDEALLEFLQAAGSPGRIAFDDPDAVIVVETVGNRAGLAVWDREEIQRYPFLRPD